MDSHLLVTGDNEQEAVTVGLQKLSKSNGARFDIPEGFEKCKDGDEFYYFISDHRSWAYLLGMEGYVKIHKSKIVDLFVTIMN